MAVPPAGGAAALDVGPAVLHAVALAGGGAAGQALEVITEVVRAGEFRRSAIEVAADLAEDAGRPDLAWAQVVRLGLTDQYEGGVRCAAWSAVPGGGSAHDPGWLA